MAEFTSSARRTSALWRTALGVIAAVIAYLFGLVLLVVAVAPMLGIDVTQDTKTLGSRPIEVIFALGSIVPAALGIALVCERLYLRSAVTLLGDISRAWTCFGAVLRITLVLFAGQFLLYLTSPQATAHLPLGQLLLWLSLALPMILLQSGAEEVIFRGFLQQQLGARFGSPLIWMVLPSALFAVLHYDPDTFGDFAIFPMIWAFAFGLMAADLTARSGNLGAAIALHFCNNVFALLLFGTAGNMDGLALYVTALDPESLAHPLSILFESLSLLIVWLGARVALRL
jgi:membrane protease YdiL (CAAX protease family)